MTYTDELVKRQAALQAEADAVAVDLGLAELAELGEPIRVGSSALGLMVKRDLDVTVVCKSLDEQTTEAVGRVGQELLRHPRVRVVTMRDDTGHWNVDPAYPDGLYLGVKYRTLAGADWTLDIWFVDEPDRQPDLEHIRTMPPRLDDESRNAILAIKEAWADNPSYGSAVSSYDIYSSVLDHGVRSPEQFLEWRTKNK
ncbi:hypothetical protein [Lentzea sp. NEAU-D7]|uniref:hypothetical protein n=1 Tax=Lentzea sp. NEAU-D7 TaxID=2994667 RepID=UPI00224A5F08|nr:hypothetical protein [Lentzea sp. NEAU-D7]MCX2954747.1 hypothetical protein [Lentzea sp. NEAU-D7]